mgnify:CR=1 FL=1|tara:strand:- start:37275 stop:38111 length:837 start_codon:yes stop_codon:yes gene_type:complete
MSCGRIALERAGTNIDNYFASEIKPHAIKVSKYNYPDIIHVGDITELTPSKLPKINLLIGGSPCQDFSIGRTGNGLERKGFHGDKSSLFFEYVRLLKTLKPEYFLLENVKMTPEHQKLVSDIIGCEPVKINSNKFTFQNRNRLYWTNIPIAEIPKDCAASFQDNKSTDHEYLQKFKVNKTPSREVMWGDGINGKCPNITDRKLVNCLTVKQDRWSNSGLVEYEDFCRYMTTNELEASQTVPLGYCDVLTKNQAENVLGDGWTIDVIVHILKGLPKTPN